MAPLTFDDYTVGWICALPVELEASAAMMDERHPRLTPPRLDTNNYRLGRIGSHNVAMACLPSGQTGTNSAANVAAHMSRTFGSLKFGLMVGIAGGAPSDKHDIRLGDIVVGKPGKTGSGVIQYDFGKAVKDGVFELTGSLNAPPTILLTAVSNLQSDPSTSQLLKELLDKTYERLQKFSFLGAENDKLFKSNYDHPGESDTCDDCDENELEKRELRSSQAPVIHYGTVASANQVMRHGGTRERVRDELDILCFEMEAAGLVNTFPCLVIRGICDYADTHKNKQWQPYAAATAAAFAKHLLTHIQAEDVKTLAPVPPMMQHFSAFCKNLLPTNTVALGRLILDVCSPWKDYCPHSVEFTEDDVAILHQPLMHKILQNSEYGKIYEQFRQMFINITGLPFENFMSAPEKTHILLNPCNHFRILCDHKEIQLWFENTVKYGCQAYMITGIHMVDLSSSSTDSATNKTSEQVFAIQCQKVKFKWFSSRTTKKSFLDTDSRWQVSSISGRDPGTIMDVDDIIQAELDDAIDLKELEVEGDIYTIGDEVVLFSEST